MDLLILKLERIDNTFYENLLKFISGHGYTPKVVIRNTDSLSINGLKIISSKRQLFRHKEEISLTSRIPCSKLTGIRLSRQSPNIHASMATWLVASRK